MHTSFFDTSDIDKRSTCVIYLHSISGSRLEAMPAMKAVTKLGYSFACFDFPGCGHSEGDLLTFGMREKEDLRLVIKYLKASQGIQHIILWGKSMGAVTALLYACKYNDINGVISDSAFSSLKRLILEMCRSFVGLPDFILKLLRKYLISIIEEKIPILVEEINLVNQMKELRAPVLFLASPEDELVTMNHSVEMYRNVTSPKRMLEISGSHNSLRPHSLYTRVSIILQNILTTGSPKATPGESESVHSISTLDSLKSNFTANPKVSATEPSANPRVTRHTVENIRHKMSYSPNIERRNTNNSKTIFNSPGFRYKYSHPIPEEGNDRLNQTDFTTSFIKKGSFIQNTNRVSEYNTLDSFHSNMGNIKGGPLVSIRKTTYDSKSEASDNYKTLRTRVYSNETQSKHDSTFSIINGISRPSRKSNLIY